MSLLHVAISLGIAIFSSSTLYHSAQSIPKLRKYESKAEKAAKWSKIAEDRLWQTRYTVAAGFGMVRFLCTDIELNQVDLENNRTILTNYYRP